MSFENKMLADCTRILDTFVADGLPRKLFLGAITTNDPSDLKEQLYNAYSKDPLLRKDLDLFRKLTVIYQNELVKAKTIVARNASSFLTYADDGHWVYCYLDPAHKGPLEYRLYLNIRVEEFSLFTEELIRHIFSESLRCWECGYQVAFNAASKSVRCSACGNADFYMQFKFHTPKQDTPVAAYKGSLSELLRNDKMVMYFKTKYAMYQMARVLDKMSKVFLGRRRYFADAATAFTHEVFPGVGFAPNTDSSDVQEYNRICAESETSISYGQYISAIMTDIIFAIVRDSGTKWSSATDERKMLLLQDRLGGALLHDARFARIKTAVQEVDEVLRKAA